MSERARDPRPGKAGSAPPSRSLDEKKIKVEFTQSFDTNFRKLSYEIQQKTQKTVEVFIKCYLTRQFPKSLRVHKCGPFLSLSVTMNYRIFILPILGGIKFLFFGTHEDADRYLKHN